MTLRPRETVILSDGPSVLVAWYRDVLGFAVTREFSDRYQYSNLETSTGMRIGIASAKEMGVEPGERQNNTVVLQIEVDDVRGFFDHVREHGGEVTFGPSFDEKDKFWFGAIRDVEGNPIWVVDAQCP